MKTNTTTPSPHRKTDYARRARAVMPVLGMLLLLPLAGCETSAPEPKSVSKGLNLSPEAGSLQEGDTLKISFPGAPNLDTTQQVKMDGKVVLPVVGEMMVAGMTPARLEKELVKRYSSQLLSKEVAVAVESSGFIVYVTGAVLRPGKIISNHPLSALEAIMEAGGFDYAKANQKAVSVIRHLGGQTKSYTVNLKLEMEGKQGGVFPLKSSDIVFVPERFAWF